MVVQEHFLGHTVFLHTLDPEQHETNTTWLSSKVERRDTAQDYAHPRMQLLPSIGKVVAMRRGQTQPVSALTFRAHQTATPTIQRCQQCLCTCHELDTRSSVAPPRGAPTLLSLKTRKSQRRQTPRQHTKCSV